MGVLTKNSKIYRRAIAAKTPPRYKWCLTVKLNILKATLTERDYLKKERGLAHRLLLIFN